MAIILPACATTVRRLRRDPRVPTRAKIVVALAGLWALSPIDLIPEFLPVIGAFDDIVVVALALRYAAKRTRSGRWAVSVLARKQSTGVVALRCRG